MPCLPKTSEKRFGENAEGAMNLRLAGAGNAGQQFL
jgi:hypothetical protein